MEMTREQSEAVLSKEPRLVVSAAAGSGKTRVLVERYLRHVEEGYSPSQILAATYTRKAAAEMRERVTRSLFERGRPEQAIEAETGPIQTLHSFYVTALRENAFAAGVDPAYRVADLETVRELASEAIADVLSDRENHTPEVRRLLSQETASSIRRTDLESLVARYLLEDLRGSGPSCQEYFELYGTLEATLRTWYTAVGHERGVPFEGTPDEWFDSLPERARPKGATFEMDQGHASNTSALIQIACKAWQILDERLWQRQELDFTLVEDKVVRMLAENEQIRERLNRQYRVILIDEAQDLNPTQHRFLESLNPDYLMLVGDPQQSIYRFRQAEVRQFVELTQRWPTLALTMNHRVESPSILQTVDALFEKIWTGDYASMVARPGADSLVPVRVWSTLKRDDYSLAARIKDCIDEGDFAAEDLAIIVKTTNDGRRIYDRLVAQEVPAKLLSARRKYYTRLEVRDIANLLLALSDPLDDYALLAVLRGPAVRLSMDAWVRFAKNRSIYAALPDLEVPAEDRERLDEFLTWFVPLQERAKHLSANEAIAELLRDSPLLGVLGRTYGGELQVANVRKLQMIAARSQLMGVREFAEYIRLIERLDIGGEESSLEDPTEPGVSIMTLHSSKGLEFDVVCLMMGNTDIHGLLREVRIDPLRKLSFVILGSDKVSLSGSFSNTMMHEIAREETWREVYVGMTRAKRCLILVATTQDRMSRVSRQIWDHLNTEDGPPRSVLVESISERAS